MLSGVTTRLRADHIGRPVFGTNTAGTKVWTASYLPFGGVRTTTGTPITARFPGQWFQSESGLHQNWMRDYDPTTGRYLQADPLGLVDGASVYGYVKGNPGRWVDSRGLCIDLCVGEVVIAGWVFDAILGTVVAGAVVGTADVVLDKAAQANERKAYKTFCGNPPPPTGDYCADLKAKLDWQKQCLSMRKAYSDKYYGDGGHPVEEANLQKGIDRMTKDLETNCPQYCPATP